ncbi:MAG TPA: HNH endonuclease signature motif containing protein, partial [Euzebya sp.]|nr:HNH endonuclease signature motif containing protein [Euzebya sp.]
HYGRQATAHQRTALEARGYECEVPHCRSTHLLEIDHIRDWAWSKQTVLTDLAWHCRTHHDQKTSHRYRLHGPPGQRTWTDPTGRIISQDQPDSPATADQPDPTRRTAATEPTVTADRQADNLSDPVRPDQPDPTPTAWPDQLHTWTDDLPDPSPVIAHLPDRQIISDPNPDCHRLRQIRRRRALRRAGWQPQRATTSAG